MKAQKKLLPRLHTKRYTCLH